MQFKSPFLTVGLLLISLLLWSGCEEDTIEPKLFGSVFGEVLDRIDNTPIIQATVSTNPPTSSVFTDAGGRFVLENIPEGTYSLRAEKNGFLTQVASVTVFGDQDANVIVRLETDSTENTPPSSAILIAPSDGAVDQDVSLTLQWSATDDDEDDELNYDVILFNADQSQSTTLISGTADTTYLLAGLDYNANYFWQVVVKDGVGPPVLGPVWGFKTRPFPNHRFLFARSVDDKYDIYSSDGIGNEIKLTDNAGSNWRPRMSPLRDKIAFISNQNIQPQLYVMDRDGNNVQRVTTVPISGANQLELDFAWSPDGTKLLYMANSVLFKINVDGTGLAAFAQAPRDFTFAECDWTLQGDLVLARIVGSDIYTSMIATINNQGAYQIFTVMDNPGAEGGAKFSISAADILYTQDASGFESQDERQLDARIIIKNIAASSVQDISHQKVNGTNDLDPIYSPDGSRVLFTNTNNDGISVKNIYVMDLDGFNRELLFENAEMGEWK